jgi:hypothetical protein
MTIDFRNARVAAYVAAGIWASLGLGAQIAAETVDWNGVAGWATALCLVMTGILSEARET